MVSEDFDFEAHRIELNQPGEWSFVVPVSGVRLSKSVNNEFRIKRVLLVAKEKLPHIRKRLGLPEQISKMHKRYKEFFVSADTFAVIRHSGVPQETKSTCRKIIQDELSILALSQLGFQRRRFGSHPSIKGFPTSGKVTDLIMNTQDARSIIGGRLLGSFTPLHLDQRWKKYQKKVFYTKYLSILNEEIKVSKSWRKELERAAILLGQSQCSNDLTQSFLWNMIALELLLTRQGDKYTEVLPKRIEAFLGWVGFWDVDNYSDRIKEVYKKRSAFVHDGRRENITIKDLLFTDDLLLNLIVNLIQHIKLFESKDKVIEFSRKIEAEYILGVKPKIRPKTLQFISRHYTEKDYQEM